MNKDVNPEKHELKVRFTLTVWRKLVAMARDDKRSINSELLFIVETFIDERLAKEAKKLKQGQREEKKGEKDE